MILQSSDNIDESVVIKGMNAYINISTYNNYNTNKHVCSCVYYERVYLSHTAMILGFSQLTCILAHVAKENRLNMNS